VTRWLATRSCQSSPNGTRRRSLNRGHRIAAAATVMVALSNGLGMPSLASAAPTAAAAGTAPAGGMVNVPPLALLFCVVVAFLLGHGASRR
jgi:hypothetical protein